MWYFFLLKLYDSRSSRTWHNSGLQPPYLSSCVILKQWKLYITMNSKCKFERREKICQDFNGLLYSLWYRINLYLVLVHPSQKLWHPSDLPLLLLPCASTSWGCNPHWHKYHQAPMWFLVEMVLQSHTLQPSYQMRLLPEGILKHIT